MEVAANQHPVSVVIPTCRRPGMVRAAVASVLAQTHPVLEVLVVLDGPELEPLAGEVCSTAEAIAGLADARVRLLRLPRPVGGAEARNVGVREARGEWIAFLDDDDLWLPEKLAAQFALLALLRAAGATRQDPVLSCKVFARSPTRQRIWPRQLYRDGQPMAEYLFCRKGWAYGDALLQTSTLLLPRSLLVRLPFPAGLLKHQDWDWLLRAAADPRVSIHSGEQPLVIFHVEGTRASVGRLPDWRFSYSWAMTRRSFFTPRAMLGFLTTECAAQAQQATLADRLALLGAVLRLCMPVSLSSPRDLLRVFAFLLVPQSGRRWLRDALQARDAAAVVAREPLSSSMPSCMR